MEPEDIVVNTKLVKLDQPLHISQKRKHSTSEDNSLQISEQIVDHFSHFQAKVDNSGRLKLELPVERKMPRFSLVLLQTKEVCNVLLPFINSIDNQEYRGRGENMIILGFHLFLCEKSGLKTGNWGEQDIKRWR